LLYQEKFMPKLQKTKAISACRRKAPKSSARRLNTAG
jgi:hypothetical protein